VLSLVFGHRDYLYLLGMFGHRDYLYLLGMFGHRDYLYLLGTAEKVPSEGGHRIQSPKHRDFNIR
jgi:hypothetical protein